MSTSDRFLIGRRMLFKTNIRSCRTHTNALADHLQQAMRISRSGADGLALAECEKALECDPDSLATHGGVRTRVFCELKRYGMR